MKLHAPAAVGTSGIVRADFTPNERQTEAVFVDLSGYAPADVSAADTTLTVRDGAYGKTDVLARAQWQLRGNTVTVAAGFEPGRTYQLSYRVRDLPVAGTGLVAFRDTASWLKHQPDAAARVSYAYAFGSSQSGRFLRYLPVRRLQQRREEPARLRRRHGAHRRSRPDLDQRARRQPQRRLGVQRDELSVHQHVRTRSHQRSIRGLAGQQSRATEPAESLFHQQRS